MSFEITDDFEIIDLGIQELDVYDIETENDHNFFGNNILVHNSVYMSLRGIVNKRWPDLTDEQEITDKINEYELTELGPYIDECYQQLSDYLNCDVNLLDMKRENIASTFIVRAKKNYLMKVLDSEHIRFAEPYYKFMGVESVKTSTPMIVRDALDNAFKIIINGSEDELRTFVQEFRKTFMSSSLYDIAKPSRITDIVKYQNKDYTKKKGITIPINSNGAITYNKLIHDMNLSNKYEYIRNSDNIRMLPLKLPNPINSHIIAFIDEFPSEFGLDDYIDKETHFEKVFISPVLSFTVFNNWTLEENALNEMFGTDLATKTIHTQRLKKTKVLKETTSLF